MRHQRLDVVFATGTLQPTTQTWRAAMSGRVGAAVPQAHASAHRSIQFALAGMNAHINNDLPIAVLDTSRELASPPLHDSPQCRDYHKVNGLLSDVEALMKKWFVNGAIARLDVACGKLDDVFAMSSISAAREIAWLQAHLLWKLRNELRLAGDYEHLLGRVVNLAGCGLLI
ncbi:MAG: DUF5995 family protein [Solirubrobacteraceae bacterium]